MQIISGLHEIAPEYDALVCDVWGVLHNGHVAFSEACAAIKRFREERGPVVLLTNAPRPVGDVEAMFVNYGVPLDCYDAIVTSGVAARIDLEKRTRNGRVEMLHLGPERDRGVFMGLDVECVEVSQASVVLCTGFYDDDIETPSDYGPLFAEMTARNLVMLCANPDLVVQRGDRLIYCAGALAQAYENAGGDVIYYGKPKPAIYDTVREIIGAGPRPLAVGDGLHTDIKGANAAGLDALFIADGVHGEDVAELTADRMDALLREAGVNARAAMRKLVW